MRFFKSHPALAALVAVALLALVGGAAYAVVREVFITIDPDKPADIKGVGEVVPGDIATAIRFCKLAAASSRRAMYELGRAYLANRQPAEVTLRTVDLGLRVCAPSLTE